ncbi:MAG: hypothetical protein WDO74_12055 [Pseudomonadota bacterium]
MTLAPALIGALLATLNLVPVALAPLFALAGTLAALLKARL